MEYQKLKDALINVWGRTDEWEKRVCLLSLTEKIKVYNLMNTALNSKVETFGYNNALAREGFEYFREIERLQKSNPAFADRIHMEVHY